MRKVKAERIEGEDQMRLREAGIEKTEEKRALLVMPFREESKMGMLLAPEQNTVFQRRVVDEKQLHAGQAHPDSSVGS